MNRVIPLLYLILISSSVAKAQLVESVDVERPAATEPILTSPPPMPRPENFRVRPRLRSQFTGTAMQVQLDGANFASGITKDRGQIAEYICQRRSQSQSGIRPGRFCQVWPRYERHITAIATTTRLPAPMLACTYLIESGFNSGSSDDVGVCSSAGACGLSQFMPGTARDLARVMKNSPEYQRLWYKFQAELGNNPPHDHRTFAASTIRGQNDVLDVQLFSTAMYYRHYNKDYEDNWRTLIQGDPSPGRRDALRAYYAFLVVSYNAGPARGETYLSRILRAKRAGQRNYFLAGDQGGLPRSTRTYIKNMEACMTRNPASSSPSFPECNRLGPGVACSN